MKSDIVWNIFLLYKYPHHQVKNFSLMLIVLYGVVALYIDSTCRLANSLDWKCFVWKDFFPFIFYHTFFFFVLSWIIFFNCQKAVFSLYLYVNSLLWMCCIVVDIDVCADTFFHSKKVHSSPFSSMEIWSVFELWKKYEFASS